MSIEEVLDRHRGIAYGSTDVLCACQPRGADWMDQDDWQDHVAEALREAGLVTETDNWQRYAYNANRRADRELLRAEAAEDALADLREQDRGSGRVAGRSP